MMYINRSPLRGFRGIMEKEAFGTSQTGGMNLNLTIKGCSEDAAANRKVKLQN